MYRKVNRRYIQLTLWGHTVWKWPEKVSFIPFVIHCFVSCFPQEIELVDSFLVQYEQRRLHHRNSKDLVCLHLPVGLLHLHFHPQWFPILLVFHSPHAENGNLVYLTTFKWISNSVSNNRIHPYFQPSFQFFCRAHYIIVLVTKAAVVW